MICPECRRRFSLQDGSTCPHCGASLAAGVVKTSTILIACGEASEVYRSVDEVPADLRSRLIQTTSGSNSATIVIADRRGQRELARLRRIKRQRLKAEAAVQKQPEPAESRIRISPLLAALLMLVLAMAAGLVGWVAAINQ